MGSFKYLSVNKVCLFLEESCTYVSTAASVVAGLSKIRSYSCGWKSRRSFQQSYSKSGSSEDFLF